MGTLIDDLKAVNVYNELKAKQLRSWADIRNAAAQMTSSGGTVITLSGFASDNPLRALGDINIWLDATDYGFVEIGHQFVLHNVADRFGAGAVA